MGSSDSLILNGEMYFKLPIQKQQSKKFSLSEIRTTVLTQEQMAWALFNSAMRFPATF
jgi:hypothetical protein